MYYCLPEGRPAEALADGSTHVLLRVQQYTLGNKVAERASLSGPVVDITDHLAFGLLFALPAWWVLDDRASVGFVALAAVADLPRRQVTSWIGERVGTRHLSVVAAIAVLVGTLSRLVADMPSAPDISTLIEASWPSDLVRYNALWINYGFSAVLLIVDVVAYLTMPAARRHRFDPL